MKIFLSASIPDLVTAEKFSDTINLPASRLAIKAFSQVCAELGMSFYCGGHPGISPLIYEACKDVNPDFDYAIYQSDFFRSADRLRMKFDDKVQWIDRIRGDKEENVLNLRKKMFELNPDTEYAVFIGGKAGVIEEAEMLIRLFHNIKLIPLATTGGASLEIFHKYCNNDAALANSFAFSSILVNYLGLK